MKVGEYEKAVCDFEKALKIDPNYSEAERQLLSSRERIEYENVFK